MATRLETLTKEVPLINLDSSQDSTKDLMRDKNGNIVQYVCHEARARSSLTKKQQ